MPESFTRSKRAILDAQQALRDDSKQAGVSPSLPLFASNYLLNQADIGMACALGTGGNMVRSLVTAYAPPTYATTSWENSTPASGTARRRN